MKTLFFLLLFPALALLSTACTQINAVVSPAQKPVVEAYLAVGQPVLLSLSTVIAYSESGGDSTSLPIDNQAVKIKVSDGRVFTLKSIGGGEYTSAAKETVQQGLSYSLDFTYNGLPVTATTTTPSRPVGFAVSKNLVYRTQRIQGQPGTLTGQDDTTPVVVTWTNPAGEYHFLATINTETSPEAVVITTNANAQNALNAIQRRVNNAPTTGALTNLQPASFAYFGKYNLVLYHLNPDYATLYRSGGTSTQNLSTPSSTITNGLGIFTGVNTDTLRVTVLKK